MIEHLTAKGAMDPRLLYASPFTGIAPSGPEQMFAEARVALLVRTIDAFNNAAVA